MGQNQAKPRGAGSTAQDAGCRRRRGGEARGVSNQPSDGMAHSSTRRVLNNSIGLPPFSMAPPSIHGSCRTPLQRLGWPAAECRTDYPGKPVRVGHSHTFKLQDSPLRN